MANSDIASLDDFLSAVMMVSPNPNYRPLDPAVLAKSAEDHKRLIAALINSPTLRARELPCVPRPQHTAEGADIKKENGIIVKKENGVLIETEGTTNASIDEKSDAKPVVSVVPEECTQETSEPSVEHRGVIVVS